MCGDDYRGDEDSRSPCASQCAHATTRRAGDLGGTPRLKYRDARRTRCVEQTCPAHRAQALARNCLRAPRASTPRCLVRKQREQPAELPDQPARGRRAPTPSRSRICMFTADMNSPQTLRRGKSLRSTIATFGPAAPAPGPLKAGRAGANDDRIVSHCTLSAQNACVNSPRRCSANRSLFDLARDWSAPGQ